MATTVPAVRLSEAEIVLEKASLGEGLAGVHAEFQAEVGAREEVSEDWKAKYRLLYSGRLPAGVSRFNPERLQNTMEAILYRIHLLDDMHQKAQEQRAKAKWHLALVEANARLNTVARRESEVAAQLELNRDVATATKALLIAQQKVELVAREAESASRDYQAVSRFLSTQQQLLSRAGGSLGG